jgi:transposase
MSNTMIGLDTAKAVFQVHAADETGQEVLRQKLKRSELVPFFKAQEPCTVVLEACSAAHHWARLLKELGHEVKLIAPEAVRPFVKKGRKNDAADAAAICEAASRPSVKFVPIKTREQQAALALHSARSLLVKQQTMLANAMRGLAAEFGLIAPQGVGKLADLMALVDADETVPELARRAIGELLGNFRTVGERIEGLEKEIVAHARHHETARRLATIPGIGPITASLITATVTDISALRVHDISLHGLAWYRDSTPPAARSALAGLPRPEIWIYAGRSFWARPQWSIEPHSGTVRPVLG